MTVHLVVDTSRSMDWGAPNKLEYAAKAAAALGYIALAGLDRVTVTALGSQGEANGGYFPPHRGKNQAFALFSFLSALAAAGRTDLAPRLRHYVAAATQPGPLLLFSDLLDEGWQDGLHALAGRGFEVTVLHLLAPEEVNPELTGDLELVDVETGAQVELTADYEMLARYRDGLAAWQAEIHRFCGARGMHYVPVETSLPFEELLFAWLRRQGVLK